MIYIVNTFVESNLLRVIPVAARSKAWVCGRSLAGIAGSIPAGGMDVCLLLTLYVAQIEVFCEGPITRPGESYSTYSE